MKPVVAAFDFDGTLARGVSGLRFFRQLLGPPRYAWFWVRQLPALTAYGLRWHDEVSLARINQHIFHGRRLIEVEQVANAFAREHLPQTIFPAALTRLREHQARGDRCVIVSRGFDLYLRPWAVAQGVDDVIATRLMVDCSGRLTGAMPEPSCDGVHKPRRLEALIGPRDTFELHAYGDGPGDFALLRTADFAWVRRGETFQPWNQPAEPPCA
jgi:phosphatidylglycerophosphatase C